MSLNIDEAARGGGSGPATCSRHIAQRLCLVSEIAFDKSSSRTVVISEVRLGACIIDASPLFEIQPEARLKQASIWTTPEISGSSVP